MGVGTFYSENDNMIVDKEIDMDYFNDIKDKLGGKEFKSLEEVVIFFNKEGLDYTADQIDWLWDEEDKEFGYDRWLDFEFENVNDSYDASLLFYTGKDNTNVVKETYYGSVEEDMNVYVELRAESKLFASHIEMGTYDDNYHSAVMATSASEELNEYINDKDGNFSDEFMLDLIYELDDEIGKFMMEIGDTMVDIAYFSFNETGKDIDIFISKYEDTIEQIKNFILNESEDLKKSPDILKLINLLNDYSKAISLLKNKRVNISDENKNDLLETIKENEQLKILQNNSGLYNSMFIILKNDIDELAINVNVTISEYFNKMIAYNKFGRFRIKTSGNTSEIAQYFNTEEDMNAVLKTLPKELQVTLKKAITTYKKQWGDISINSKK